MADIDDGIRIEAEEIKREDGSGANSQDETRAKPDKQNVISEQEPSSVINPLALIDKAISMNLDVDKLEKLMELQERWDKNQAKKAFDESMMGFQSECPIIQRQKEGGVTKDGQVAYMYAPLEAIVAQVKPLLAKYGFSSLIKTEFPEGKVRAICVVRHKQGHSEESIMEVPLMRQTGVMNDSQVVAATVTFAKRYAYCNAFGIMTADEDVDGIAEDLLKQFDDIIKNYTNSDYIKKVAGTIEKSSKFKKWLATIPTAEQAQQLKELLTENAINLSEEQHDFIWLNFQKQTNQSFDRWLKGFKSSKLYKEKEIK